jgi:hypothetical protein
LRDDELVATLAALGAYYTARADLHRAGQLVDVLRVTLGEGRHWFGQVIEARSGLLAWLRGDFHAATCHLETATAGLAAGDQHRTDAVWFLPADAIALAHIYLASARFVGGDLADANAELARAVRRTEQLGFPQGPFSLGYARSIEIWMRIEAGQLEQAAILVADLTELAERHGFDMWRLYGAMCQAIVGGVAALDAHDVDLLAAHVATLTTVVDTLHALGLLINVTMFEAMLGRLLIAAGQPELACARLDSALALAHDTGMCCYDAELMRIRAQTHDEPAARDAEINAALELARRQGATLFELRAALDDFELRGQPARAALIDAASRIPTNNAWPELVRAQAALADQSPRT